MHACMHTIKLCFLKNEKNKGVRVLCAQPANHSPYPISLTPLFLTLMAHNLKCLGWVDRWMDDDKKVQPQRLTVCLSVCELVPVSP